MKKTELTREYKVVECLSGVLESELNKLGDEGWELVNASQDQKVSSFSSVWILFLKRPVL